MFSKQSRSLFPGYSSGFRAASPSPTVTAAAAAAVAAAAVAAVAFVTQTPRAWCPGSRSCWTSCTPLGSVCTRPGTSASCSWISASSSACLSRTQRRSVHEREQEAVQCELNAALIYNYRG